MLYSTVSEPATQTTWRPAADVYRSSSGWLLKLELAGVALEDITVAARGSALTVSGVRRDQAADGDYCQYLMEISYSRFERKIHLPCEIETAAMDIKFVNGILLVYVNL